MSFTLYIHAGSGKTGSTAIQQSLTDCEKQLEGQKVKYLGLMLEGINNPTEEWQQPYGWPVFAKDKQRNMQELVNILKHSISELNQKGWHSAIWSNEALFGEFNLLGKVKEIEKELDVKVKVICYFRNHVSWTVSAYKQWGIKHKSYAGPVKSFKQWKETVGPGFSHVALRLEDIFGDDFIIKNYDADKDLVENFFKICEIDVTSIDIKNNAANKTPGKVPLSLWAIYNSQFDKEVMPNKMEPLLRRSGLLSRNVSGVSYNDLVPSDADFEELKIKCKSDNDNINERLIKAGEPPLEFPNSPNVDEAVSQDDIIAGLVMILAQHDVEIRQLKRKINLLEKGK